MLLFSPAKINLGLQVLRKRNDGFHDLQSLMYPIPFSDLIEIMPLAHGKDPLEFIQSGLRFPGDREDNICIQAWELIQQDIKLPSLKIHLHKQIPVGAGLGGGSSNASTVLRGLNTLGKHPLSPAELSAVAAELGSDCPFFLEEGPMLMEGRGEILSPFESILEASFLVLLSPGIHVSSAKAYAGVEPRIPEHYLKELLGKSLEKWKDAILNDFEESVFTSYPFIGELKNKLYQAGATYASMSGSGSALYGIFREMPRLSEDLSSYIIWQGKL